VNSQQFSPEPEPKWTRRDFDLKHLEGKSTRERAEIETNRDLSKPVEQLVCDFHDIAEISLKGIAGNSMANREAILQIQAEKRMVSLMGRVALEHQRDSRALVNLTRYLVALTVVLTVMTAVLIWETFILMKHENSAKSVTTAKTLQSEAATNPSAVTSIVSNVATPSTPR
jgi:hypothetical protein